MSYDGYLDKQNVGHLASNTGLLEFGEWAESLGPEAAAVKQLAQYGWSNQLENLEAQLEASLPAAPPDVASIGETIREMLHAESGALTFTMSNGALDE
mgnify:CR=1 FL=1